MRGVRGVHAVFCIRAQSCATCSPSRPKHTRRRDAPAEGTRRGRRPGPGRVAATSRRPARDRPPDTPDATRALDERFLRERLCEVAMAFLERCLVGSPTMLVVEDVHYIDEAIERSPASPFGCWRGESARSRRHPPGSRHSSRRRRRAGSALIVALPAAARNDRARGARRRRHRARIRWRPTRFSRSSVARAATRSSSSNCSQPCARPGRRRRSRLRRVVDRRRHRPPLPHRPDSPPLRRRPRRELRPRDPRDGGGRGGRSRRRGVVATRGSRPSRVVGPVPFQEHADPRCRVRGPSVSAAPRTARSRRRDDRDTGGVHHRRRARDARRPLLRGPALGKGLGVLSTKWRPRDGDVRKRRRGALLREGLVCSAAHAAHREARDRRGLGATRGCPLPPRRVRARRHGVQSRTRARAGPVCSGRTARTQTGNPVVPPWPLLTGAEANLAGVDTPRSRERARGLRGTSPAVHAVWLDPLLPRTPGRDDRLVRPLRSRSPTCARQGRAGSGIPDPRRRLHGKRGDREGRLR